MGPVSGSKIKDASTKRERPALEGGRTWQTRWTKAEFPCISWSVGSWPRATCPGGPGLSPSGLSGHRLWSLEARLAKAAEELQVA